MKRDPCVGLFFLSMILSSPIFEGWKKKRQVKLPQ